MSGRYSRYIEFGYVGIASMFVQAIFLRKLIGLFGGSEVLYALIITIWLIETGIWSWIAERFISRGGKVLRWKLSLAYISLGLLFLYYQIIPLVREALFTSYGTMPLSHCVLFSLSALIFPTLFPGAAFALIYFAQSAEKISVSRAYFFDSFGFALGGVFVTILFSIIGRDLSLLLLIGAVGLGIHQVFHGAGKRRVAMLLVLGILSLVAVYNLGKAISTWCHDCAVGDSYSESFFYDKINLDSSSRRLALSPYGHVEAVSDSLALNIYYNSKRTSTYPDPPTEEEITIPIAMCGNPRSICVIGNSCDGKALFAMYDSAVSVVQIEPDPVLCNIFSRTLSAELHHRFDPKRFSLEHVDPVDFLTCSDGRYDVIYLNYSDPAGIAHSIYFTREFFQLIKSNLSPCGVLAFSVKCGENFIPIERLEYIKNLYITLESVFPNIEIIPGEKAMLIGGKAESSLTSNPYEILSALVAYDGHLRYVSEAYLPDRLSVFRKEKLSGLLASVDGKALTVGKPGQYLLNTILEMDKFSGFDSKFLRGLRSLPDLVIFVIAIFPLGIFAAIAFIRSKRINLYLPAFFSGWWGISCEILLMVVYQSVAGNLYSRLGLLVGLFMIGIALGAWTGERVAKSSWNTIRVLRYMLIAGMLAAIVTGIIIPMLLAEFEARVVIEYLIFALALLSGVIPGGTFNLSVSRYAQTHTKESPGKFYATDLFGAAIGGLVTSLLILPLLGIQSGFYILAAISFMVVVYMHLRS